MKNFSKSTKLMEEAVKALEEEAGGVEAMRKQYQEEQRQAKELEAWRWSQFWRWTGEKHPDLAKRAVAALNTLPECTEEEELAAMDTPEYHIWTNIPVGEMPIEHRVNWNEFLDLYFATSTETLYAHSIIYWAGLMGLDPNDANIEEKIDRRFQQMDDMNDKAEADMRRWAAKEGLNPDANDIWERYTECQDKLKTH
jgi:hypothetical protein